MESNDFCIVGIGASAGGHDPLVKIFKNLDENKSFRIQASLKKCFENPLQGTKTYENKKILFQNMSCKRKKIQEEKT